MRMTMMHGASTIADRNTRGQWAWKHAEGTVVRGRGAAPRSMEHGILRLARHNLEDESPCRSSQTSQDPASDSRELTLNR